MTSDLARLGGILLLAAAVWAAPSHAVEGHLDRKALPEGCGSCHLGHGAPGSAMLPARDHLACLTCHGGGAAVLGKGRRGSLRLDVRSRVKEVGRDFQKPYRHPVETSFLHRRDEVLPERDPGAARHVGCLDCHDAHRPLAIGVRKRGLLRTRPRPASLRGVTYEYELCYRCHGESANRPRSARNVEAEFHLANASFHPVESSGRSPSVPSLRKPYTAQSVIGCVDCHGSDEPGARGPHGSVHAGMLVAPFSTLDGQMEGDFAYRLCYRCHERLSILSGRSFTGHPTHLQDPLRQTSCRTCHNPHGSRENAHLVDFNPAVVTPTSTGELLYRSEGTRQGSCYLTCHGAEHAPGRYCPPEVYCDKGRVSRSAGGTTGSTGQPLSTPYASPFDDGPAGLSPPRLP